jgi:MFS family permease
MPADSHAEPPRPMGAQERWNVAKSTTCESCFGMALNLVAPVTALPLLLGYLGAGKVLIGLSFSIASAGWFVLQLPGMMIFGRRQRTKRFLIPWAASVCLPTYIGLAAVVYLLPHTHPTLCSYLILLIFAVRIMVGGMNTPVWMDWQARLFRRQIRGHAIGFIAGGSAVGACVAAVASGRLQAWMGFLDSYPVLFLAAGVLSLTGLSVLSFVHEAEHVSAPGPQLRVKDLFQRFGVSWREPNYRNYLWGRAILTLGGGATAFAVHFHTPEGGAVPADLVVTLGLFLFVVNAVSAPLLGRLGDHAGHKGGVILGALSQCGAIAAAYWGRGTAACAVCFGLLGVAFASSWVSHNNMLFETCPHDSRVAHLALSNLFFMPFAFGIPIATGVLMDALGYHAGIGLTLIPTALGTLYLLLSVREPRTVELLNGEGP